MFAIAQVTWKEWAAYRSHMAVSLLTGPLRFVVMTWIWTTTMNSSGTAGGLSLENLVTYSAMTSLVSFTIHDFADWNLQMLIRTGRYANHLLQPLPHPFYAFGQKLGHRALGILIEAIPVWILVSLWLGRVLVPHNLFWFGLSVVQGFVLLFVVNYTMGLTGFWLVRAEGIRRCLELLRNILAGALLPLSFFPEAIQSILMVLPFPWILYVPLRIGLGSIELTGQILSPATAVGFQSLALLAWGSVFYFLNRIATRRFLAVGG